MEGPRGEKGDRKPSISSQPKVARFADDADSRSDPTFTCASPGLAVAGPNSLKVVVVIVVVTTNEKKTKIPVPELGPPKN